MSEKTNKLQFSYSYYKEQFFTAPIFALFIAGWSGMEKYQWAKESFATPSTPKSTPLRCRDMPTYAEIGGSRLDFLDDTSSKIIYELKPFN